MNTLLAIISLPMVHGPILAFIFTFFLGFCEWVDERLKERKNRNQP
jgi:hypothetical protein